ncbi:MAG: hypothetical protein J6A53_03475 [Clostridia bacterium]|nr:hypothetical protein [Clostridia bacterium]
MINNKKIKLPIAVAFIAIQSILFFVVQLTSGLACIISSYTVVVLCCLYAMLHIEKSKDYVFTQIALVCTVMADLFLVVIHPIKQLPAMIFFSSTQICYFLRLYFNSKSEKEKRIHLIVRAVASLLALLITIIVLKQKTDAVSLISMFYYANLIINIVFAFVQYKKSQLFAIGLLLFLGCDTLVGLNALLSDYITSPNGQQICNAIFGTLNWAWIFYVPSQACLALSLTKLKFKKNAH